MDVRGRPANFYDKARFLVEIDLVTYAGFQSVSDVSGAFAGKMYHDGASPTPFKKAGKETYPNVTLEQGASEDRDLEDWWNLVRSSVRGYGVVPEAYKRNVTIVQIDEAGDRQREIVLFNAHPVNMVMGSWDATDQEGFVIKSLELAYDELEIVS